MNELHEDYNYIGDINLEYGGLFINLDDWQWGYVQCVRVTDLDSACGFTGAVMIEHIVALIPDNKDKMLQCFSVLGLDKLTAKTSKDRKIQMIDAIISYGYYDPDDSWDNYHTGYTSIVQCENDKDYAPMSYDGWKAEHRLTKEEELLDWLLANDHLRDM